MEASVLLQVFYRLIVRLEEVGGEELEGIDSRISSRIE